MKPQYHIELLKTLWNTGKVRRLSTPDGRIIEVRKAGEYDDAAGHFAGAEIIENDTVYCGNVVMWAGDNPPSGNYESCVLQVVPYPGSCMLKQDGSPLIQGVMKVPPICELVYETLREGASKYNCAKYIANMESHVRVNMFTRLLADRLARKCNEIKAIYEECEMNWNETMYVMLVRTMGDHRNKEAFTELARRVKYGMLLRERESVLYVEAMLLGTSGLLEIYGDDTYVRDLKTSYEYLRNKYNIMPMVAGQWSVSGNNPNNHPVIRMAQLATFFTTRDFIFENMMKCRTVEDIHDFFRTEASQYWSTHYIPSVRSAEYPKRLGHFKANILGINLVVPMMFSYGDYAGDESMKEMAVDMLEKINYEENTIMDSWRGGGVRMESAFDSQAMLQLNNEFCLKGLCWRCPVGRRVVGAVLADSHS